MRIRPSVAADAPALAEPYTPSVRGIGPRDYTSAEVEAWASLAPTADEQDRPVAFADVEQDGHNRILLLLTEYCRRGSDPGALRNT